MTELIEIVVNRVADQVARSHRDKMIERLNSVRLIPPSFAVIRYTTGSMLKPRLQSVIIAGI
jgi:hypothetical protein